MNLSNRKIQSMKILKKNISKMFQEEYRKRYFYSLKYYYISKINPLFSNSKIVSTINFRFREFKYEYDDKDYILAINYESIIIRTIIKMIILNNQSYSLHNIFPSYFCLEKQYFDIMQKYIQTKRILYKEINDLKGKKDISKEIEDEYKDNEISLLKLINDDNIIKDESKYKDNEKDKEEEINKKNSSMKSLLSLTKKMIKNKGEYKYNKIKELFLDNDGLKYYTNYCNKENFMNIKFLNGMTKLRKRASLPEIPSGYLEERILKTKTEKNKPLQIIGSRNIKKNKIDKKVTIANKLKALKDGKYKNKFLPISYFNNKIKEKKEKIENLNKILNNCEINVKYNDKEHDEIMINNNKINIFKREGNIQLIRKFHSKKCKKELDYNELTYYGVMGKNRKLVRTEMVNKIIQLTSKNSYNINLYYNKDKKNKIFDINKIIGNKKILSNSNGNNNKYFLKTRINKI